MKSPLNVPTWTSPSPRTAYPSTLMIRCSIFPCTRYIVTEEVHKWATDYRQRESKQVYDRLDWKKERNKLGINKTFPEVHRMTEEAFDVLVDLLRDDITLSDRHAMSSTGQHRTIS